MTQPTATGLLRLCPDCGGILEPSAPTWLETIDLATASSVTRGDSRRWQCPLCGYTEAAVDTDILEAWLPAPPRSHSRAPAR
ncbi:MAG: hypothetical protein HYX76_00840 [Acidobacteria bacterium]|nr:hypothetical protein [Acidobacteriota bacterium]